MEILRKRLLFLVFIIFVIFTLPLVFYILSPKERETAPPPKAKREYITLSKKPLLSGDIIQNPDFIYSDGGWLSGENPADPYIFLYRESIDWKSDGFYDNHTSLGERGIGMVVIHPIDRNKGRYVEQTVYLPQGKKYYLVFGLSNVLRYYTRDYGPVSCNDNIFRMVIVDGTNKIAYTVFQEALNTNDGWKDFAVDISDFAGKTITVRLEGLAGGPCGDWNGEFGAVDYIDILTYFPE